MNQSVKSTKSHVVALINRIFDRVEPEDVDRVVNRVMGVHPDACAAAELFEYQMRGVGSIRDDAIVKPAFSNESGETVGDVQRLLSEALSADGLTEWPDGTAAAVLSKVNLREFEVQFEDVGFTTSDLSGRRITKSEAAGFTETATKENTLPARVVAVVGGYITEDDEQRSQIEKKVYLCIKLRVLAEDEADAEAFPPPLALLSTLADMVDRDEGANVDLELEGNWEVSSGSAVMVDPVHSDGSTKTAPQVNKAYRVHLYAVVRVPVDVPSASSQHEAIAKAEKSVDLQYEFRRGEYADELVGILVDEMGDEESLNSTNYAPTTQFDAGEDCWKVPVTQELFCVTLNWASDDDEQGDYATTVWACSADEAIRLAAEEMADSGEVCFTTDEDRVEFIQARIDEAGPNAAEAVKRVVDRYLAEMLADRPEALAQINAIMNGERACADDHCRNLETPSGNHIGLRTMTDATPVMVPQKRLLTTRNALLQAIRHAEWVATAVARAIFDACKRQVEKGRSLDNLNIDAIADRVNHEGAVSNGPESINPVPETRMRM